MYIVLKIRPTTIFGLVFFLLFKLYVIFIYLKFPVILSFNIKNFLLFYQQYFDIFNEETILKYSSTFFL